MILLFATPVLISSTLSQAHAKPGFAAVGDWGCNNNTRETVKNINNHRKSTILGLGDNSYQNTATCWYDIIRPLDGDADPSNVKRVKITIGNHETSPSSLLNSYKSHFHLNKLYYSVEREYVHILSMNSEDSDRSNVNSAQYQFVKTDLENAHNNPNIKWIIVMAHAPFFSSPNGCSASSCKGSESFTRAYQTLFEQNKVDMVLFGHVHNYQRMFPLTFNSNNPLNPIKASSELKNYTDPAGPIYAIVGTGGVNFHSLGSKAAFVVTQQANKFGQMDIAFSSTGDRLDAQFCANDPNNADPCSKTANILDKFSITKSFTTSGINPSSIKNADGPLSGFELGSDPFSTMN